MPQRRPDQKPQARSTENGLRGRCSPGKLACAVAVRPFEYCRCSPEGAGALGRRWGMQPQAQAGVQARRRNRPSWRAAARAHTPLQRARTHLTVSDEHPPLNQTPPFRCDSPGLPASGEVPASRAPEAWRRGAGPAPPIKSPGLEARRTGSGVGACLGSQRAPTRFARLSTADAHPKGPRLWWRGPRTAAPGVSPEKER